MCQFFYYNENQQLEALKFKESYAEGFEGGEVIPDYLQTSEDLIFDFMIHELLRMGYRKAGKKRVIDFYKAVYHENLKNKRDKYLIDSKK